MEKASILAELNKKALPNLIRLYSSTKLSVIYK
jgi:hypothetical protein